MLPWSSGYKLLAKQMLPNSYMCIYGWLHAECCHLRLPKLTPVRLSPMQLRKKSCSLCIGWRCVCILKRQLKDMHIHKHIYITNLKELLYYFKEIFVYFHKWRPLDSRTLFLIYISRHTENVNISFPNI